MSTQLKWMVSAIFFLAVTLEAQAYEAGEILIKLAPVTVAPRDDSSTLAINGVSVPGTSASVDPAVSLGFTIGYMVTPHVGIELLGATPFDHTIKESGVGIGKVGAVKHLPPTLSVQYYPMQSNSKIQPYFGLGLNYTLFFNDNTSSAFDAAFGPSNLDLEDSIGWAGQVGLDYQIHDRWLVNFSAWYINIDTKADFSTPTLGAERIDVDVDINPLVLMLGVGYKF